MRTAADFNQFYAAPDPWSISNAKFRDRVFRSHLSEIITHRSILELGCGEGHLTETVFDGAASVLGIDISDVAILRAKQRGLKNARFETGDFLDRSFKSFDIIAAFECLYYLSKQEQETFFQKAAAEHHGLLILSSPIIGTNNFGTYFTHQDLMRLFERFGFRLLTFRNLNVYRTGPLTTLSAALARLSPVILGALPTSMIYQRLYIIRIM
jgi:predicted TPR repeat methyltransferase